MMSRKHNIALALDALETLEDMATAQGRPETAQDLALARARVDHVWLNSISRDAFEGICPVTLRATRAYVGLHQTLLTWAWCQCDNALMEADLRREEALLRSFELSMPEERAAVPDCN